MALILTKMMTFFWSPFYVSQVVVRNTDDKRESNAVLVLVICVGYYEVPNASLLPIISSLDLNILGKHPKNSCAKKKCLTQADTQKRDTFFWKSADMIMLTGWCPSSQPLHKLLKSSSTDLNRSRHLRQLVYVTTQQPTNKQIFAKTQDESRLLNNRYESTN